MWNISVSERCCQHCDGVIYKRDSVIETKHYEDECRTSKTSVCRVLPGMLERFFYQNNLFLNFL